MRYTINGISPIYNGLRYLCLTRHIFEYYCEHKENDIKFQKFESMQIIFPQLKHIYHLPQS